ncbi:hypothetical protein EV643_12014 [Kribbella sp. VKM Ac-2527]|uniref:Uncharacterized protein n=1 Tax=Kribbella caucasensis TaxID=2512215 RepID=A0A4R6JJC9_9ACTN|nr:hypothetical protein EV643_12014 [Kribbella sp. VKM Ac-2527]
MHSVGEHMAENADLTERGSRVNRPGLDALLLHWNAALATCTYDEQTNAEVAHDVLVLTVWM